MERQKLLKVLNNKRSSKEDLRQALAEALGVPYEKPNEEKEHTLYNLCQREFMKQYRDYVQLDYSFSGRDAKALQEIIHKLSSLDGVNSSEMTYKTFCGLVTNLPEWYKKNAFALPVINKNLNAIIGGIRNGRKQTIGDEELAARLLRKIQS